MTSVNYSIGLNDNERSSSRVLRPPGGGHSDIFGLKENNPPTELEKPKASTQIGSIIHHDRDSDAQRNKASFQSSQIGFGGYDEIENNKVAAAAAAVHNKIEDQIDNKAAPEEKAASAKRVPPGGHSAGFW